MGAETKAVLDYVTFGVALLGAVLGVYNAWRNWVQDRVRLRVKTSMDGGADDAQSVVIEVINLSSFPVTITHVGFNLLGTDRHAQIPFPHFTRGETLPVRLESRTSVTVLHAAAIAPPYGWQIVRSVYVLTACGLKRRCSGRAFDKYRAALAAERSPRGF